MKKITILMLFFFVKFSAFSQVSTYAFTETTETYSAVVGTNSTATGDDGIQNGIPIGFTFKYDGVDYTNFSLSTNGWIRLGNASITGVIGTSNYSNALSTTATNRPLITPFWDDNNRGTGAISYSLSGTAPNQVLEVGWDAINIGGDGLTSATNLASYKLRLYETSNVIEFIYGATMNSAGVLTASVGLNGVSTFLSVTPGTTSTVSAVTANNAIASTTNLVGKKFIFTPPACLAPSAISSANITASTADISWTAPSPVPASGYEYVVTTSNTTPTGAGTGASGTTVSLTGLSPATNYYVFVRSNCGGSFSAWNGPATFLTLCVPLTTLPWTENFDALTALGTTSYPPCWTKENGDWSTTNATTRNTPKSGANYLRDAYTATNEYIWTPGFSLTAGTSYDFSTFVQGDNGSTWFVDMFYNTSANSNGATQLGTAYNPSGSGGTYSPQSYVEMRRTFVPSTTGVYFFAIRVNEASGSPWYVAFDDFKLELTPSCSAPSVPLANNITQTNADLSWGAVVGSINYEYVLNTQASDPVAAGTSITATTYSTNTLAPYTDYYFHVRSNCGAGGFSTWSTVSFKTLPIPPVNDNCAAPIALTVGGVYTDNDIDTTNLGGTLSAETPNPTCGTTDFTISGKDIWFSVVVPASGSLTIETNVDSVGGAGLLLDTVIAAYSGTCGALTQLGCDDFSGNGTTPVGADYSKMSLTGLTVGDTLLIRAYGWSGSQGTFSISAYDASLATTSFDLAGFKALPNPVKDVFKVSYVKEISSITVHNLLGQEIINKKVNGFNSDVDMSNLASGTYLVKVTSEGLTNTIKVIKE